MTKNQGTLKRLEKEIELLRNQMHEVHADRNSFSDRDVYRLSLMLDRVINEYQEIMKAPSMDHKS